MFNLLEGDVQVVLVNACHVKQVPGRKTDKADARWLAKRLRYGLLQARFIPSPGQRELHDLTHDRSKLVQERSREVNRVQGMLERANMKRASVAMDIMGVSGRAILAELAKRRLRSKLPLLEQALTGLMRDRHRQVLAIQLTHLGFLDEQIHALSAAIIRAIRPPRRSKRSRRQEAVQTRIPPQPKVTFTQAVTLKE